MKDSVAVGARSHAVGATATSTAAGTFGELLQGTLPEGRDFLVTLPITRRARAVLTLDPGHSTLRVYPADRYKARELVARALARHGLSSGGALRLDGNLPIGKGFASSSADLVATARALGEALKLRLSSGAIAELLREIEPSDGVMYPGAVAFYHREVRLLESFGPLPPTTIVAVDEGGKVDTVEFNRLDKPFNRRERRRFAELLAILGTAIRTGDLSAVGAVATESAQLNQKLNPKQTLPGMIQVCRAVGGVGVAVAHSGTTVGILIDDDDPQCGEKVTRAVDECRRHRAEVSVYHSDRS